MAKGKVRSFRRELVGVSFLLIAIGVIFLIYPDSAGKIICYLIGASLCVGGIAALIIYFMTGWGVAFSSFGLVRGAALIVVGVFILVKPEFLLSFLTSILGIVLIVDGVLKLQYSIDLLRMKVRNWWIILILALLMAALGVVVLMNPFNAALTLLTFIGISMIVDGAADLGTILYVSASVKRIQKAQEAEENVQNREENAVDAEIIE